MDEEEEATDGVPSRDSDDKGTAGGEERAHSQASAGEPGSTGGQKLGATTREEAALKRARAVGRLLDDAVRVPGTDFRIGLDPVLGIIPGAGDAVAGALALYPIVEAYRLDAPPRTLAKMISLVAIDTVVGSIPVIGPVFDAFWKANKWNVQALERHLQSD